MVSFNKLTVLVSLIVLPLVACNRGGSSSSPATEPAATYKVQVNTVNLNNDPLTVSLNDADQMVISNSGTSTFSTTLESGEHYEVKIEVPPTPDHYCNLSDETGTIDSADVVVNLTCTYNP